MAGQVTLTKRGEGAWCARCEDPILEQWDPNRRLCASCALEEDLFDREGRLERLGRL